MKAFGIGENFINWVRTIYSNATSVLSINGFFSEQIPLKRGVRQGCPLSSLLYVLVIEVFAIQLRLNPNIVGFKVGGEKIVSAHYMDDTTIIIKQNRCFKEVIKEIELYEEASNAKVNYEKTKGLWVGSWKGRRTSPINNIKWTSGDVENLGVYFGNENPGLKTFQKIVPKFKRRLGYWKQFSLTKIGKARVVEMFLASKMIYAIKFYPIPKNFQKEIQNSIFQYINFPNKVITISQKEMWKIKLNGGCKLVNIQVKSETSKAKWLMEMTTNPHLKVNLDIFTALIGIKKGNNSGINLIFMHKPHITRVMGIDSPFYKEALAATSIFERKKGIEDIKDWDEQPIFYNPLIIGRSGKTLKETDYHRKNGVYKLGQLLEEKSKEARNLPFDKTITALANNITLDTDVEKDDMVILGDRKKVKMSLITQKELYEDAILKMSTDHTYQTKWVAKLNNVILWEEVWNSVHNFLISNKTRTIIWEQLHLNFYTQYSYNKWHDKQEMCPLCNKVPESIYHVILHCDFVNSIWTHMQPILSQLYSKSISDEEKALGIITIKSTNGILLRNWLTYKLREQVMQFERISYHSPNVASFELFKAKFNQSMASEVKQLMFRYNNENKLSIFDSTIAYQGILCEKIQDGEYRLKKLLS